jgi:cysteine desulfuration protein SufE
MTIKEIETEIVEEFDLFGDDWEGKYEHLIELGKSLPLIEEKYKTEDRLIKGCQSRVWLHSEIKDGKVIYTADSDAIITKGLVALMVRVLSGQQPGDIVNADLTFIDKIGLKEHLSPTRANGLVSMIKQMKLDALALSKISPNSGHPTTN